MSDPSATTRAPHASGSHYQPRLSVALVIVVLFVAATFFMVRAVTPSPATPPTSSIPPTTSTTKAPAPVVKSAVRVQVANGTLITGLAGAYTQKLTTQNWDALSPANGPRVAATVVYYNRGFRQAALDVASAIHVSSSSVQALGALTPVSGASTDDVIVVLGPNSAIG